MCQSVTDVDYDCFVLWTTWCDFKSCGVGLCHGVFGKRFEGFPKCHVVLKSSQVVVVEDYLALGVFTSGLGLCETSRF